MKQTTIAVLAILYFTIFVQAQSTQLPLFNGKDSYIDLGTDEALSAMSLGDFTVEVWVKMPKRYRNQTLISNYEYKKRGWKIDVTPEGKISVDIRGFTSTTYISIDDNQWHYIAVVRRLNKSIKVYIDGQEALSNAIKQGAFQIENNPIYLGAYKNAHKAVKPYFFEGTMDEVRIWNKALTSKELAENCHKRLSGNIPNLLASWNLSEISRNATNGKASEKQNVKLVNIEIATSSSPFDFEELPFQWDTTLFARKAEITTYQPFDGRNSFVNLGNSTTLNSFTKGDFTIEAWIKTKLNNDRQTIIGNSYGVPCWHLGLFYSGQLYIYLKDKYFISSANLDDGKWHHVAVSHTMNDSIRLFVDGLLVFSKHSKEGSFELTTNTVIGGSVDYEYTLDRFNGFIDEVRIWTKALSLEAIAMQRCQTLTGQEESLLGYWRFENADGNRLPNLTKYDLDGELVNISNDRNWEIPLPMGIGKAMATCTLSTDEKRQLGFPSGDIQKDTALANQWHRETFGESKWGYISTPKYYRALSLYEPYNLPKQEIKYKSLLCKHLAYNYWSTSVPFGEEAIKQAKSVYDTDLHPDLVDAYVGLTDWFYNVKPELAVSYGRKALQLVEKPSKNYSFLLWRLVDACLAAKEFDFLDTILVDFEKDLYQFKTFEYELYHFYTYKTRYYEAVGICDKAIIFGKKALEQYNENGFTNNKIRRIHFLLSSCYLKTGDYEKSTEHLNEYITQLEQAGDIFFINQAFTKVSSIYADLNQYDEAIKYMKKAEEYLTIDTVRYAAHLSRVYSSLVKLYTNIQEYDKALSYQKLSKRYGESYFQAYNYAFLLQKTGKYDKGLEQVQLALTLLLKNFEDTNLDKNPSKYDLILERDIRTGNTLGLKSKLLYLKAMKTADEEQVIYLLRQSIETGELARYAHNRLLEQANSSEKNNIALLQGLLAFNHIPAHYELYQRSQKETDLNDLFESIEQHKAQLLLTHFSKNKLPKSVIQQEKNISKAIRMYQQKVALAESDSLQYFKDKLFEAHVQMEKYWENTTKNYPHQSSFISNIQHVSPKDIQNVLTDSCLLVTYSYTNEFLYIHTISKQQQNIVQVPLTNQFSKKITLYKEKLMSQLLVQKSVREKFVKVSNELYQVLIAPIEAELTDKKTLLIVPEGELYAIPFDGLLATTENKALYELDFLVKRFAINYHYSATTFLEIQRRPTITDNSLLAFAPVFNKSLDIEAHRPSSSFRLSGYGSIDNGQFVNLPFSKKEVIAIADMLSNDQSTILLEENATKENLKKLLPATPYQFIHIATHGLVNYENPEFSALACHGDNGNPNNFLYANEILMDDLQADLVVLSSCESGVGQIFQSEGALALNRTFIQMGARNTLYSLWKINDKYSSELMIDFYKNYVEGQSYTDALHQAKLKMLQDPYAAQPRFWAAFVLMGK